MLYSEFQMDHLGPLLGSFEALGRHFKLLTYRFLMQTMRARDTFAFENMPSSRFSIKDWLSLSLN